MAKSVDRFLQRIVYFAVVPAAPPLIEFAATNSLSQPSFLLGFAFYVFLSASAMFTLFLGILSFLLSLPIFLLTMAAYQQTLPAAAIACLTLMTIVVFCCHFLSGWIIHLVWGDPFFPWDRDDD